MFVDRVTIEVEAGRRRRRLHELPSREIPSRAAVPMAATAGHGGSIIMIAETGVDSLSVLGHPQSNGAPNEASTAAESNATAAAPKT